MNKILYWASCLAVCTACNDFLDEMPDNRTSLDSEKNIASLLVTAYPDQTNAMIGEMLSDNVDENKRTYSFWAKVQEELYLWRCLMKRLRIVHTAYGVLVIKPYPRQITHCKR